MKTAQTEKILFALLDYQKFDGDAALDALIVETERRCARALSEDELELVSAAGETTAELRKQNQKGGKP